MNPVDNFIGFFRQQVALISTLAGSEEITAYSSDPLVRVALHKKILFSALLDALASIRYKGELKNNNQRFTELLKSHTDWGDGSLVSVPVLMSRLKDSSTALASEAARILSKYSTDRGNSLPLSAFDRSMLDLLPIARNDHETKLLEKSTHWNLIYKYRNFIVHEFREPGYAMEAFADGDAPCYHSYIGPDAKWHLLYPERFFCKLAVSALDSLEKYLRENDIDPYDRLENSYNWLS